MCAYNYMYVLVCSDGTTVKGGHDYVNVGVID